MQSNNRKLNFGVFQSSGYYVFFRNNEQNNLVYLMKNMIVHYAWFTSQVLVARKGIYIYIWKKICLSPLNVVSLLFPTFFLLSSIYILVLRTPLFFWHTIKPGQWGQARFYSMSFFLTAAIDVEVVWSTVLLLIRYLIDLWGIFSFICVIW